MNREEYYKPCTKCGRPQTYCRGECCGTPKCKTDTCIRYGKPGCGCDAVIPTATVATKADIKGLTNCFVHVADTNTTFYVDDKGAAIETWAGLASVNNYDFDANPLGFRNQIVYDYDADKAAIYNQWGEYAEFPIGVTPESYNWLTEKPSINGVTLQGNKSLDDLGISSAISTAAAQATEDAVDEMIEKTALVFDTVAGMKASTDLVDGSYAQTIGYHAANDGGAGLYKIRERTAADVEDNGSIIFIGDDLVAELIYEDYVRPEQFGAYGDGAHDDSTAITNAIACADVKGLEGKTYYVTQAFTVNNKNLEDLHLKAEPFEVEHGNTYYRVLNLTGVNNLRNVSVESEFKYIPSIEIYVDPSSTTGLASNVQAFFVTAGVTNFYDCKCNYCWPFNISDSGSANIYDFIGTNLEMGFFISSSNPVRVYNSKFTINKLINSIYYHHIYSIEGTDSEFNNCEFTETGTGNIGNHYHGYSTSFIDTMSVSGKLVLNDCKLVTTGDVGQINGVNLYVNGGSVEGNLLLIGGSYTNKPTGYFKDCEIKIKNTGTNPLSRSKINLTNCHITIASGTKYFTNLSYKVYGCVVDHLSGTFGNQVEATSGSMCTDEIVLSNTIINAKTMSWCYPYYASNVKILNCTFNLGELKSNTNPTDRSTVGVMYGCVFSNWTLPFNGDSANTLKYQYIADGTTVANIS